MILILRWFLSKISNKTHCQYCKYYYIDEKCKMTITRSNLIKYYKNRINKIALDNLIEKKHRLMEEPLCGLISKFLIYDRERVIRFTKLIPCSIKNKDNNCKDFKKVL